MEGHGFFVGHDLQLLHSGLEALALLRAAGHFAEQLLGVVELGQLGFALEEGHVLVQHGNIVAAPGKQHVILPAPLSERGHGLVKVRGVGQVVLGDMGDTGNARMQPDVMLRLNELGKGIHHPEAFIHLHRANLNQFKQQLGTHALESGGVVGDGLVPFQVQDDVLHGKDSFGLCAIRD